MSKEIVIVLKNGETVMGDEYRYNHFTRSFELINHTRLVSEVAPEEIREMRTGKISSHSMDDTGDA